MKPQRASAAFLLLGYLSITTAQAQNPGATHELDDLWEFEKTVVHLVADLDPENPQTVLLGDLYGGTLLRVAGNCRGEANASEVVPVPKGNAKFKTRLTEHHSTEDSASHFESRRSASASYSGQYGDLSAAYTGRTERHTVSALTQRTFGLTTSVVFARQAERWLPPAAPALPAGSAARYYVDTRLFGAGYHLEWILTERTTSTYSMEVEALRATLDAQFSPWNAKGSVELSQRAQDSLSQFMRDFDLTLTFHGYGGDVAELAKIPERTLVGEIQDVNTLLSSISNWIGTWARSEFVIAFALAPFESGHRVPSFRDDFTARASLALQRERSLWAALTLTDPRTIGTAMWKADETVWSELKDARAKNDAYLAQLRAWARNADAGQVEEVPTPPVELGDEDFGGYCLPAGALVTFRRVDFGKTVNNIDGVSWLLELAGRDAERPRRSASVPGWLRQEASVTFQTWDCEPVRPIRLYWGRRSGVERVVDGMEFSLTFGALRRTRTHAVEENFGGVGVLSGREILSACFDEMKKKTRPDAIEIAKPVGNGASVVFRVKFLD